MLAPVITLNVSKVIIISLIIGKQQINSTDRYLPLRVATQWIPNMKNELRYRSLEEKRMT